MNRIDPTHRETRRHFFRDCAIGLGSMALGSQLHRDTIQAAQLGQMRPHHPPKAKSVIFLFMAGGPSQLELFEPKPELQNLHDQPIPDSFIEGKRFAFMSSFTKEKPKLLGTARKFFREPKTGMWFSECVPHMATIADEMTMVRTMATDVFNHGPAKVFTNTGFSQFGKPSMGAWINYGIGSECDDLPGFVVLQSGPRGPRGGAANWGSGFLPTTYQGVPFRSGGDPITNLSSPPGISGQRQRDAIDAIGDLNRARLDATGDPEIATRINSYEMAFRMQTSAPELIDIRSESEQTLRMYGATPGKPSFANNCILARRLVERGVRFVQLYHTNWDHHGGNSENLGKTLDQVTREVDQSSAALVRDLKARGLLDETLVIWGGEFGRTPMGEVRDTVGRNHHIDAYHMWLAGGGVKAGHVHGETDELGFGPISGRVHVHDLQATILHLLGLDHERLTFKFQGRDFRLTDVAGRVVWHLLA